VKPCVFIHSNDKQMVGALSRSTRERNSPTLTSTCGSSAGGLRVLPGYEAAWLRDGLARVAQRRSAVLTPLRFLPRS
jgi:hypothetical protein